MNDHRTDDHRPAAEPVLFAQKELKKRATLFFDRLARIISDDLEREDFFQHLLDSMVELLHAERGALFLNWDGKLRFASGRNVNKASIRDAQEISQSAVDVAVKDRLTIHSLDARTDARFKESRSVAVNEIRSLLCSPLVAGETVVGALYLDSRLNAQLFSEDDIELFSIGSKLIASVINKSPAYRILQDQLSSLQSEFIIRLNEAFLVAQVESMKEVLKRVVLTAKNLSNALLLGETGVGKGVLARLIHDKSERAHMPFVAYHCATTPETLFESQLFGHARGAFTDARYEKKGLIETAENGTLFLDEIDTVPLSVQAKLLGVLEEKVYRRLGDTHSRKVNIRLICASNKDLGFLIKSGLFREDLFYRINTITIKIPPLRERKKDILLLAQCFLKKFSMELKKDITGFEPQVISTLTAFHWPGNIRELRNVVEHAVIFSTGSQITRDTLPQDLIPEQQDTQTLRENKLGSEQRQIIETLTKSHGNVTHAARKLNLTPRHLRRLLKKYDINRMDYYPSKQDLSYGTQ